MRFVIILLILLLVVSDGVEGQNNKDAKIFIFKPKQKNLNILFGTNESFGFNGQIEFYATSKNNNLIFFVGGGVNVLPTQKLNKYSQEINYTSNQYILNVGIGKHLYFYKFIPKVSFNIDGGLSCGLENNNINTPYFNLSNNDKNIIVYGANAGIKINYLLNDHLFITMYNRNTYLYNSLSYLITLNAGIGLSFLLN